MTWSAVLSDAAVRLLRTAAGRRALQVALLVGGVLALGLLCGERAYAADGVRALANSPAGRSVSAQAEPGVQTQAAQSQPGVDAPAPQAEPTPSHLVSGTMAGATSGTTFETASGATSETTSGARAGDPQDGTARHQHHPIRPVDSIARSVAERVVRPAGDVVTAVTEALAEAQAKAPPLSQLPGPPALPKLPDSPVPPGLPDLPAPPDGGVTLPGLPGSPGLPELPGHHPLPTPAPSAPQPGVTTTPPAEAPASGGRSGAAVAVVYGPGFAGPGADTAAHGDEHRAAQAGHAPAHQAPAGSPDGTLGNRSAADSGTSRHGGDAHAVTLIDRAPLRLVPGAAARADAAGTRDRHRDIPVFPG